jgi:pimeloyl-ACP methyl ester carboxylesterase
MSTVRSGLVALGLVLAASTALPAAAVTQAAHPSPVASSDRVTVDGGSVRVRCRGVEAPGRPVVVLLPGYGDPLTRMRGLQSTLAEQVRVCAYDRLGEGASDAPPRTQGITATEQVLTAVLDRVAPGSPVVLVGHSLGGLIAARYTGDHPDRVQGLVLLDATGPTTTTDVARIIPVNAPGIAGAVRAQQVDVTRGGGRERLQLRDTPVRSAGNLPVTVVAHTPGYLTTSVPTYGPALERAWTAGQRHWLNLSSHSTLVTAARSSHYIYLDQPRLVVREVHRVVEQLTPA